MGNSGDVVWDITNLSVGEITTLTLVAQIDTLPLSGTITNTAEITDDSGVDDDSDPTDGSEGTDSIDDNDVTNDNDVGDEDDSDFAVIDPVYEYDLALIKSADTSIPYARGSTIIFEILVMNQGDMVSGDYIVEDVLPPELNFVSASPTAASDPGVGNTGSVRWSDSGLSLIHI